MKAQLEKIEKEQIDYKKIKTGSIVMLKYTLQHCDGKDKVNFAKPFTVVFYKQKERIFSDYRFECDKTHHDSYCTFYQDNKFVVFSSQKTIDFITEVIKY